MFGMLDYRAHKLLWLIFLPFRIISKLSFFVVILASILIAQSMSYGGLVKIIIAYIIMEAILIFLSLGLSLIIFVPLKKSFFWLVDVIPSYGRNAAEAETVVLQGGKLFQLNKKFESEIENWTFDDTDAYVPLVFNWRARLFFKVKNRFDHVVTQLQQIQQQTGQQPGTLGRKRIEEVRENVPGGHITWIERVIVTPQLFNSLMGFVIIVIALAYIHADIQGAIGAITLLLVPAYILVKATYQIAAGKMYFWKKPVKQ